MDRETKKHIIQIVAFAVIFYCAMMHLNIVWSLLCSLLSLFLPFILGGSIAFIINVPMKQIEKYLFQKNQKMQKMKRTVSYILTLIAVFGILTLAMTVIIPELVRTAKTLAGQVPAALSTMQEWFRENSENLPSISAFIENSELDITSISSKATDILQSAATGIISSGFSLISNVVSGIVSFLIGVVFSVYVLFQKEKLATQTKKILYAILPESKADKVVSVGKLSNQVFSNFLSGQCLEACILGTMFVVAMSIFRMPYAMLIGVIIALTALIPIVGAFIGCVVGMFLIVMVNPVQAVWFLVLFLVIQQIEGNLIYPRVVGGSIGLPSMWVLVAVSVGGSLFGIMGILVFIPLCSVCYALFRDFIHARLKKKKVKKDKYETYDS